MSFINFTGHIKRSFEKVLREIFSGELAPLGYRYSPEKEKSQIAIYRDDPRVAEKYPCIIIDASGGSLDMTTLGNEEFGILKNKDGVPSYLISSGQIIADISITVRADTQDDRENIIDALGIFLRSIARNALAQENIAYNRIEFAGETSDTSPTGDTKFNGEIRIPGCFLDWESKIKLEGAIIKDIEVNADSVNVEVGS